MTTQLPPQGPPEPDEKLPGEAELAALYRQLPQSEPGPALDSAVLRAAAQALAPDDESPTQLRERRKAERERGDWVHPKPTVPSPVSSPIPGSHTRRPRWLIALSTAATLVLAAGLAWRMREMPPATSTSAAMDSAAPAQAMATSSLPPATAMQAAEPVPPPPELPRQPPPQVVAVSTATPAADALRQAVADQSAERASSKVRGIGGLSHRPTPMPALAAPPPAPPAPPPAAQEVSSNAAVAAPEAPAAMAAAPAPIAQPVQKATSPSTSDTPAQELDKIQLLFKQGHDDEARQRLAAFQHAYPQWDLPPELRVQLHKP